MHVLPLLYTLVMFAFSAAVFLRYLRRGGSHLPIWTIGVILIYGGFIRATTIPAKAVVLEATS